MEPYLIDWEVTLMLNPGERSILAYFGSSMDAEKASKKLKNMGYKDVQVDRVSKFGVNHDDEYNNPMMGRAETGTGLTLYSANTDKFSNSDTRVLMGADPSVSGFAGNEMAGGEAFLVTVVTTDAGFDLAEKVLKQHGAQL
ncbi:MAG: hypothetical protein FH756_20190 [Firmicutes bacterium]|nr:hypothetical protein [Bacillota bacterium]